MGDLPFVWLSGGERKGDFIGFIFSGVDVEPSIGGGGERLGGIASSKT